jgi:hypothetical protein
MVKTIIVSVVVAIVILGECLFAYMLIPSRSELETWATAKAQKEHAGSGHGDDAHGDAKHGDAKQGDGKHGEGHKEIEVDLGKYNVVVHQPAANMTLKVNFHLIGTVLETDHHEFEELLTKSQHRLRDQAIFEVRNSQIEDLTDPGLALLKRRILAKSNDLFGKPLLHAVVFSDFSFIEQ